MKQTFFTFLYVLIGFIIGICISEPIISNDPLFKELLRNKLLHYFQNMYECKASGNLHHINLLFGTLVLTDITVQPMQSDDDWSWHSTKCTISISPLAWLFTPNIPTQLIFDDFTINTAYKNKSCSIIPHFQRLFKVPETPTPFFIHQLSLSKLHGNVYDQQHRTICHFNATFEMIWQNNTIDNRLILTDATLTLPDLIPLHLQGPAHISIFNPLGNNNITISFDQKLSCAINDQSHCLSIKGSWQENQGQIQIEKNNIALACIHLQSDGSFSMDCNQLHQLMPLPIAYRFNLNAQGTINNRAATAYSSLSTHAPSTSTTGTFSFKYPFVYGTLRTHYNDAIMDAIVCCNLIHQHAFVYLHNTTDLSIGSIHAPANSFKLLACFNRYTYCLQGSFNSYVMRFEGSVNPGPWLPHGWIKHKQRQLLSLWPDRDQQKMHGFIDCNYFSHPQLQMNGLFNFVLQYNYPYLTLNGHGKQPWIAPTICNSITCSNAQLVLDLAQQTITIPHLEFELHKGLVHIQDGIITKDSFAIPLIAEQCFIRPDPDLNALISANLLFKKDTSCSAQGTITLEQCNYHKNILAAELMQQMTTNAVDIPELLKATNLDINVVTQQPINVKTSFLTGQVLSHLKLSNTVTNPIIEGSLDIAQGTLHFPYKPLHITQGSLIFLPYQPRDPIINMTAKNRIKKYQITLRAHGTINNPSIHLESSPTLSNEQIIALLLTGSQERSLAITIPTLVMQQIQQLMFGPALADSLLTHYFKKLTKPFKNVRFIPHLTDQSARGGIRAGLEINYDDNLRAYIQKNLTLTEDTFFEVEYQCTDHVSIRGIKDEHGDLGAEVEMRWKF